MRNNKGGFYITYKIANPDTKELEAIRKAEHLIKNETGKDYIMIAWEKDK